MLHKKREWTPTNSKQMATNLNDKVTNDSPIVWVHSGAKCVKYSGHPDLHLGLLLICIPYIIKTSVKDINSFFETLKKRLIKTEK